MGNVFLYTIGALSLGTVTTAVAIPTLRKMLWVDVKNLGLRIWDLADMANDWPHDLARAYHHRPRHSVMVPSSRAWSMTL